MIAPDVLPAPPRSPYGACRSPGTGRRLPLPALLTSLAALIFGACGRVPNPFGAASCDPGDPGFTFVEENGLLIIETESTGVTGEWALRSRTPDYTGSGYLQWEGPNSYSQPGNGLLRYHLRVTTTGTYRFRWRSRINEGTDSTEGNDAWLRFPDAADFYGLQGESSYVYPGDSGKSPQPNGASREGWFKIYQNQLDRWSWQTRTSDNDAHDVYVEFATPGDYVMEISGRSQGFAIDRIVLAAVARLEAEDAPAPTDESLAESGSTCR